MNLYRDQNKKQFLSWEHSKPFQPENISYPSEYNGEDDLRLACTQLNLTPSKQRHLVKEWCEFLPTLHDVKKVFFYSRVPQELFDAVCEMPQLDSLFIKWSGNAITDFSRIKKLSNLSRLYVGSCTSIETLEPFSELPSLKWLELHELKKIRDIGPLSKLTDLIGLIFTGGMFEKQIIDDLHSIKFLTNLEYLQISNLLAKSGDLTPLTFLKKLKYLDTPIYYEMYEYVKLYSALPDCDHGISAYRTTGEICKKCSSGELVLPMSKGKRRICLNCQKDKVQIVLDDFSNLLTSIEVG